MNTTLKLAATILAAAIALPASAQLAPKAQEGGFDRPQRDEWGVNLSRDAAHQLSPSISGNRVVWEDRRFGPAESAIVLHDLATGRQDVLTPRGTVNVLPAIDGDNVVFARLPGYPEDWQLIRHHIPTRTETLFSIIPRSLGLGRFSVSGERVVWHTQRDGNWDIYLHDFASGTERRVTTDAAEQADPSIDGDFIVWADRRHGNPWWDVYLYDIVFASETRITQAVTLARGPVISGARIVWGDLRNYSNGFSLYEYDLRTQRERYVPTSGIENFLSLSGSILAWTNRNDASPNGYDDVFVYDLKASREARLTSSPALQWMPAVSGHFVVWEDHRDGRGEIFFADLRQVFYPGL